MSLFSRVFRKQSPVAKNLKQAAEQGSASNPTSPAGSDSTGKSGESDIFTSEEWKQAQAAGKSDDWGEMLKAAQALTRQFPDHPLALHVLGACYREQGKYDDAVAVLRRVITLNPDCSEAWSDLAMSYGGLGKYDDAATAFLKSIKLKPTDPQAWYKLGSCYQKQEQYDDAVTAYREAIKLKPDDADAWHDLGLAYGKLNKTDDAVAAFRQAIKLEPDDPEAWYNLGVAYESQDKHGDAFAACEQAVKLKPDLSRSLVRSWRVLRASGQVRRGDSSLPTSDQIETRLS